MIRVIKYISLAAVGVLFTIWIFCLPRDLFENVSYSTIVEDCNGTLLGARLAEDQQWRFPACDSVPEKFKVALIEFEDRNFYRHCGVSARGLARAVVQNLRSGRVVSGGSTLSMQVIRLSRGGERTLWTKFVECFMATRLEARYTKDEILLLYASHAPFGGNVVGIDAAMWRYLGNNGRDLSWAEAATLAVLQNAPSQITPSKNRDALLAKRNRLLRRLCDKGAISEDEYSVSIEEPLLNEPYAMPQYVPHLVDAYNISSRGEKVITGIDYQLQRQVDDVTSRWSQELRQSGANDLAAVIMDVHTGKTIAYCGNADMGFERDGRWVDAAAAPRSSGSILKPILYALSLQEGQILPHMLISDIPTDFGGFAPKNFSGTFSGAIPADEAVAQSLNVPCVAMLKDFGVMKFIDVLKASGATTFSDRSRDYGLSVILGGAEVTLVDITRLYAEMSACYQSSDSLKYRDFPINDKVSLYQTFEAMRKVNRPDQLDWRRVSSVQNVAWKTGTSYGSRDAWAVGVTPRYAVGVWVGNVGGSATPGLTGARAAGPVLFDLIDLLPRSEWFSEPGEQDGTVLATCRHSGHRAGRYCKDIVHERVPDKGAESSVCPFCQPVHLSSDGRHQVTDRNEKTVTKYMFSLPPEMEYYYKNNHPEYHSLPHAKEPQAGKAVDDSVIRFLYPSEGSVIRVPVGLDGHIGKITCSLAHTDPSIEVFWHCDQHYLGSTEDIHSQTIELQRGVHTILAIDALGRTAKVTFSVL
jgi:penicillin-binding protein 1C